MGVPYLLRYTCYTSVFRGVDEYGGYKYGFQRGLTFHTESEAMEEAEKLSHDRDIVYVFNEQTREIAFTFDRRC